MNILKKRYKIKKVLQLLLRSFCLVLVGIYLQIQNILILNYSLLFQQDSHKIKPAFTRLDIPVGVDKGINLNHI